MKKWLKLGKFLITAPGWVKGLLLVLLLLGLILAPVLGILAVGLLLVGGLLWLLLKPLAGLTKRLT